MKSTEEYTAAANMLAQQLLKTESKEYLATRLALELITKQMQEDAQAQYQPQIDAQERKLSEMVDSLIRQIGIMDRQLANLPRKLAASGGKKKGKNFEQKGEAVFDFLNERAGTKRKELLKLLTHPHPFNMTWEDAVNAYRRWKSRRNEN